MAAITCEQDYRRALKEIDSLMMAGTCTLKGKRLDELVTAVEAWENEHYRLTLTDNKSP